MVKQKTQIEKFREAAKAIEAVTDEDYGLGMGALLQKL